MIMKVFSQLLVVFMFSFTVHASVPTEEGLLRNLNNADLPGQFITVKTMIESLSESDKKDYVKFQIALDGASNVALLQTTYSNGQMFNSQIKNVKYFPDLLSQIKKEKNPDKSLFYSVLMMLTSNRSQGMEVFLEKNGVEVVKNKNILNEEKMKLLRAYRSYLVNSKNKGDMGSPLNPEDPKNKEKILELFRSNTFERVKNIELVKKDNEFMWKVDWKSTQGFFSNEERRFRAVEYSTADMQIKIEASNYLLFNGTNELPKFMNVKDSTGQLYKIQTLSMDVKRSDKRLSEAYQEIKRTPEQSEVSFPFLY